MGRVIRAPGPFPFVHPCAWQEDEWQVPSCAHGQVNWARLLHLVEGHQISKHALCFFCQQALGTVMMMLVREAWCVVRMHTHMGAACADQLRLK